MVKVTVKWGKEKFDDVELDTSDSVTAFKGILLSMTGGLLRWIDNTATFTPLTNS
jgi:hypothetical protein